MIEKAPPRNPSLSPEQRVINERTQAIREKGFELGRRVTYPDTSAPGGRGRGVFLWITDEGRMVIGPLSSRLEDFLHQEGERLVPDNEKLSQLSSYDPKDVEQIEGSIIFQSKKEKR